MIRLALGELFDRIALGGDDHAAVSFPAEHVRWGYRDLHARVTQLAKGLIGLGVDPGDRVAVIADNRPEWVTLQLAVAKVGAVLVPLDPAADAAELVDVLAHSEASTAFLGNRRDDTSPSDALLAHCPDLGRTRAGHIASRRLPALKRAAFLAAGEALAPWVLAWAEVLAAGAGITDHLLRRRYEGIDPADAVVILYAFENGAPAKGAELSHVNVVDNAAAVADLLRLTARDRVCVPVPLFRAFGYVLGTVAVLGRGATMVMPGETFDADAMLAAIADERCTVLYGEPRMFASAARSATVLRVDLSSLRTGIMTGAPCPPEVMREIAERLRIRELTVAYGQNEATAVVTQTRREDSLDLRVTTVGRALPHVEVRVVDPSTGVEVARGTEGELCCRGSLVMRGYHGMPEATAAVIGPNGWLRTGTLAVMDQHGYCAVTGRVPQSIRTPTPRA